MTVSEMEKLAARHLRFQRDLLALWHHTCRACELSGPGAWECWVAGRQRLVQEVAAQDGSKLAAETAAARGNGSEGLASRLAAFHELEVGTMRAILRLEARLRAAAQRRLWGISGDLRATEQAQMARREYRAPERAVPRLSRRG
ncbi:MAG TPA: hypothetical protein VMY87_12180 [Armatimonadota bacterium]|nr:hypothetical protein [Armatimonadota bacterium]